LGFSLFFFKISLDKILMLLYLGVERENMMNTNNQITAQRKDLRWVSSPVIVISSRLFHSDAHRTNTLRSLHLGAHYLAEGFLCGSSQPKNITRRGGTINQTIMPMVVGDVSTPNVIRPPHKNTPFSWLLSSLCRRSGGMGIICGGE
jgi:hypothetical protein